MNKILKIIWDKNIKTNKPKVLLKISPIKLGGGALHLTTSTFGEKGHIFHSLSWKKGHFALCDTTPLPPDFYALGASKLSTFTECQSTLSVLPQRFYW